jgi:hypothetical protein
MSEEPTREELIGQADRYAEQLLRSLMGSLMGIEVHVRILRERHPDLDDARVADMLIEDAVSNAGRFGVAVALPTLIPLLAGPLMFGTIAADTGLLLREQLALLLKLSYLYDPNKARADREMEALEMLALHASSDERPTNAAPIVAGQLARMGFKHIARRIMHSIWKKFIRIWAIPLSLIISAKINRDAVAEIGDFAALELSKRKDRGV